jgi:hypothetical protein
MARSLPRSCAWFPAEAGLCPYIAGPALSPSAIARTLLSYLAEYVEQVFSEAQLRLNGVLRSWLRGSAGGIMLVVEGQIPL